MLFRACWKPSSVEGGIGPFLLSRTPSLTAFLSICLFVSASRGKSRPFADTPLSLTHTYTFSLFLYITLVLSIHLSIHLTAFLPTVSGVFGARASTVASGVIQCDRMMSITQAQACWPGPLHTHTHSVYRDRGKQTCWLWLYCHQLILKPSLLHNK